MPTVTSRDGTRIAFSRVGQGPPVVLIDGLQHTYWRVDPDRLTAALTLALARTS